MSNFNFTPDRFRLTGHGMRLGTIRGSDFGEVSSAMQKAIRHGETQHAGYAFRRMLCPYQGRRGLAREPRLDVLRAKSWSIWKRHSPQPGTMQNPSRMGLCSGLCFFMGHRRSACDVWEVASASCRRSGFWNKEGPRTGVGVKRRSSCNQIWLSPSLGSGSRPGFICFLKFGAGGGVGWCGTG